MPEIVIGRDLEDLKQFGTGGTIYLGKHLVGAGEDSHTTTPVFLDILRPHIITLCGKRGSGKSYSMGVFVEEMMKLPDDIKEGLCSVVIDTQGIFWTMKSPAESGTELREWGLAPMGFDVSVYVPEGQALTFSKSGVSFDGTFSVAPSQLSYNDWLSIFKIEINDPAGVLLQRVLSKMPPSYTIDDMVDSLRLAKGFDKEKMALENLFVGAKYWGIFGEKKMPEVLESGKCSIIDVSLTPQAVRALLVSIISRRIFTERTKARRQEEQNLIEGDHIRKVPMCWIMIDEAHNFIPNDSTTAASESLLKIVKEGRQPGISLMLASQQPYKLHSDALSQCDLIISHRLTSKEDMDSLEAIMQSYVLSKIMKYIDELPRMVGVAIVLDDNSERLYKIRIRPRQSWHAGSSPTAVFSL